MSVVIETTLGDFTIDLFTNDCPTASLNFLKLCKIKYYNFNLFHYVHTDFIAQTGDPTGSRKGGESIFGVLEGPMKRFFEPVSRTKIKNTEMGLVSFVADKKGSIGSQFFITLGPNLTYLDDKHCLFGEIVDGFEVLQKFNEAICDGNYRPYQDIRITHTVILHDPFPDPENLNIPERSPSPSAKRLQGGRIAPDEDINDFNGKTSEEVEEMQAEREAKARATILEMVGDIPDAEMAPPENVLFVCKLNPVTTDDDLEIIFSRFGKINFCEVIRDRKTGDSLQYAFIEFNDKKCCEDAYFKMDNVLIDDRRIHVDFSQSVAKIKWLGKGKGVKYFEDKEQNTSNKKESYQKINLKREKTDESNKYLVKDKERKEAVKTQRQIAKDDKKTDQEEIDKKKEKRNKTEREHSRDDEKKNQRNYTVEGKNEKYRNKFNDDERKEKERRHAKSEDKYKKDDKKEKEKDKRRHYKDDKKEKRKEERRRYEDEKINEKNRRISKDKEKKDDGKYCRDRNGKDRKTERGKNERRCSKDRKSYDRIQEGKNYKKEIKENRTIQKGSSELKESRPNDVLNVHSSDD